MSISIRLSLREDLKDRDGLCPIHINIWIDGERVRKNTEKKIPEQFWDKENREIKKSFPNADIHNALLRQMMSDIDREVATRQLNRQPITAMAVKNLLKNDKGKGDFYEYADRHVLPQYKNKGSRKRYMVEYDKLKAYAPKLQWSDIDPIFLRKYYKHLTESTNEEDKANSHNTALSGLKLIRKVFNHAIDHGITNLYPFKTNTTKTTYANPYKFPDYEETNKEPLQLWEREAIEKLMRGTEDPAIRMITAYFLLECYTGFRHSDWKNFKVMERLNGDELFIRAAKNGKRVSLPLDLMPSLLSILDFIKENNIEYTSNLRDTNMLLKTIGKMCKCSQDLTTHAGRRTCATMWYERGCSEKFIAELLGITLPQVRVYAKFTSNKMRTEIERTGSI